MKIRGICTSCLIGYGEVAPAMKPLPCIVQDCPGVIRKLAAPQEYWSFVDLPLEQREDLRIAPWVPGHAAVLVSE